MRCVIIIAISKKSILMSWLGWCIPIGIHTVTCIALLASLTVVNAGFTLIAAICRSPDSSISRSITYINAANLVNVDNANLATETSSLYRSV